MEHLSSCYFCGAAVGTDVREYPIVSGDLPGVDLPPVEQRATVTLCSGCRGKLDTLLEAGLGGVHPEGSAGAAGSAGVESPGARPESPTDPSGDAGGESTPSISPDAEIFGDADPVPVDETEDSTAGAASGPADADADREQAVPTTDDAGAEAGSADPESAQQGESTAEDEASDDEGAEGTDSAPGGGDPVDVDGEGAREEGSAGQASPTAASDEDDRSFSASQAAGGRSTSSHGESDEGRTDGGDGDDGGGVDGVPREVHNKVVRLLQNREFPVEREEILTVATSAYGLDRRNCEAAIEGLIDRGIVEADGEQLLRADD